VQITYYAGAADAAGTATAILDDGPLTAADLRSRLGEGNERLGDVLPHCTLLVDGSPVRDPGEVVPGTARVDVLPPFAGG
jgi:molybdopterin converting factor small subunit